MRARVVVVVAALAGCHHVFSLDPPRDAATVDMADPADAPPLVVRGTYFLRSSRNTDVQVPEVFEYLHPPSEITIEVRLDDGTRPAVVYDTGTFEFVRNRDDQPYRIVFTTPDSHFELEHTAAMLTVMRAAAGRLDAAPLAPSRIDFAYPAAPGPARSAAYVATTGVWSHTHTGQTGPQVMFAWETAIAAGGLPLAMLDSSRHDLLYVFEVEALPDNFSTIAAVSVNNVTTLPSGVSFAAQPTEVTDNGCVTYMAPNGQAAARVANATPHAIARSADDVYVFAVPSAARTGTSGAIWLAVLGSAAAADRMGVRTFYNPFIGHDLLVEAGALVGFDVSIPGAQPSPQVNAVRRYHPFTSTSVTDCPPVESTSTIALAGSATLAGTSLATDQVTVTLGAEEVVPFLWSYAASGPAHLTAASLYELVAAPQPSGAIVTAFAHRQSVHTTGTSVHFDRSMFTTGSYYMVAIQGRLDLPHAADGDLATVAAPFEYSVMWTRRFRIAP